jgi:uncharacterized RDD family membrane protein YckC
MTAGSPAGQGSRSYAPEETVTGEGVALELPVASIGMRVLSGMIDVIFHVGLLIGVFMATDALTEEASEAVSRTGVIVSFVGVLVGVPTASEALSRGKTLGKLITGLRVVRDDGGPISFRHALTRALVAWVEVYVLTGIAAVISALVTARTKRLGDLAAGTYVIAERSRIQLPPPPAAPPELEGWASHADIAALDPDLAVAVRQFLPRANLLVPQARYELGQQLVSRVLPLVAPAPPPGHHPESILRAVMAERYRRDLDRLRREQALREAVLPSRHAERA